MPARTTLLKAGHWSKSFGARTVLSDVGFEIRSGEVLGLVGQNGSGKSTLIKILAGAHHPDPGATLVVHGREVLMPLGLGATHRMGLAFVHQDLGLLGSGTVMENLRLGRFKTGLGGRISWAAERRIVKDVLERYRIAARPDDLISTLGHGDRALLAIAKAIEQVRDDERAGSGEHPMLILDEPTPHLPRDEAERLFQNLREFAAMGIGIVLVTHRLDEIMRNTDRVMVLRDGKVAARRETAGLTEDDLVADILGFTLEDLYPAPSEARRGGPVLQVSGLCGTRVSNFSLELREGETVGLTGLMEMGWEEVPYLLFGAEKASSGEVAVRDHKRPASSTTPAGAVANGLALVPADRLNAGILPNATVRENMTLPTLGRYRAKGFLSRRAETQRVQGLIERFDVRPPIAEMAVGQLSGGNQQKVVLAKWLETGPCVLLLHEPTQGVDVGARAQIFSLLREATGRGIAIVFASAEWEDLAHMCDRVLVFRDGVVVAEIPREELSEERIADRSLRNLDAPGRPPGSPSGGVGVAAASEAAAGGAV